MMSQKIEVFTTTDENLKFYILRYETSRAVTIKIAPCSLVVVTNVGNTDIAVPEYSASCPRIQ
jgi:hypothetical protein